MLGSDTVNYLKDIAELKQQIALLTKDVLSLHTSTLEKLLVTALPALGGALIGGLISLLLFKLNQKSEKRKKEYAESKERTELIRKLYGEAHGTNSLLLNYISSMNYHNSQRHYFSAVYAVPENEFKEDSLKKHYQEYERYLDTHDKVKELLAKFYAIVAEYYYINPSSEIMNDISSFLATDFNVAKVQNINAKTLDALAIQVTKVVNDGADYAQKTFAPQTKMIIEKIRTNK